VREQGEEVMLWALVDTEAPLEVREFVVYGTGHRCHAAENHKVNYLGTAHLNGGALVFHAFEVLR
jgi:hypothetical protein